MNLECSLTTRNEVDVQLSAITLLSASKSLDTLSVFIHTTKTEVFETNDALVGDTCKIHAVVPYIIVVLHPLVTSHEASNTCRIIVVWWQTEDLETFTCYLSTCILSTIAGLSCPLVVLSVWIVSCDLYNTTISNRLLVPCNLHWSNHCLTSISKATWWTMIEYIPLTIDLLQ